MSARPMEVGATARPPMRLRLPFPRTPRSAVVQFALSGLVVVLLLGLGTVQVLRHLGTTEAIHRAQDVTELAGKGIVAPAIGPGVLAGRPAALRRLDRLVRARILHGAVVRVKLWDGTGRIVYADAPQLDGRRFSLREDEVRALRTGSADAEVSDLARPENRYERGRGKLLEVYQGIRAPGGRRLLFESYQTFSSIAETGRQVWLRFLPILLVALVALELLQIPLARSLARRLASGQRERERLLRRAIESSEVERRRVARDLHDGPVQNLAGVGFSLGATAQRLRQAGDAEGAAGVERAATSTRESLRSLRSLLVELYPPSLSRAGLAAAVSDLLAPLAGSGIAARADVPEDLGLEPEQEALLYRVAQEAVRNVRAHSRATEATVAASRRNGDVRLEVADNGRGFDAEDRPSGHFGLQMLSDLACEAGGRLEVDSAPGSGTRVVVTVPVR